MINEQKFVITKSFRELVENFNDGFKILTINGPKGVGKSLALAAICALNKGKSPCLVISPLTTISSGYFHNYVKEVYAQHGKSKCFIGGNCSRFLIFPLSGVTIQWPLYHSYSYNIVSHLPNESRRAIFSKGRGAMPPDPGIGAIGLKDEGTWVWCINCCYYYHRVLHRLYSVCL